MAAEIVAKVTQEAHFLFGTTASSSSLALSPGKSFLKSFLSQFKIVSHIFLNHTGASAVRDQTFLECTRESPSLSIGSTFTPPISRK